MPKHVGGFLVSPAKDPGPQPITIQNNGAHAQTFSVTPVPTIMSGKFCEPVPTQTVAWFHVQSTVTVPPGKAVSLPVTISGKHATTDVGIKVAPAAASHGVGVAYVDYAQEIIGGLHGSGCAKVQGVTSHVPVASAPVSHSATPDILGAAAAGVLVAVIGAAVIAKMRRTPKPRRERGAHRGRRL